MKVLFLLLILGMFTSLALAADEDCGASDDGVRTAAEVAIDGTPKPKTGSNADGDQ